jgi:hypothetical protein
VSDDDLGLWPDGAVANPTAGWGLRAYAALLPAYPDEQVIPLIRVPAPTLLPEGTPEMQADFLARLYFNARTAFCGKHPLRVPRTGVARMRLYPSLLRAVNRLNEVALPPASWVRWRFQSWQGRVAAGVVRRAWEGPIPGMAWVYGAPRMAKDIELARAHGMTAPAGRVHVSHTALIARYKAAREALDALPVNSPREDAQAAVDPFLTGYDAEVLRVTRSVALYQRTMEGLIATGGWLWV